MSFNDPNGEVQTVATQSLQTWTTVNEAGLGWDDPAMVGGFDEANLDSWADISEVIATECWSKEAGVVGEQISCGPMPCPPYPPPASESGYPAAQQALADAVAARRPGLPVAAPGSVEATAEWLSHEVRAGDAVLVMGGGRSYQIGELLLEALAAVEAR